MVTKTLRVEQAWDRALIEELPQDSAADLERKLALAQKAFRDRAGWLKPHQRSAVLLKTAELLLGRKDEFATLIAREGGKPWPDAVVEVVRAVDGLRNAADELRNFAGREVPMGLTAASEGRWAFTTKEPIGVVAAISAFNHPLNLIVHQVAPAIAVGAPIIVKPAQVTPLSCLALVKLLREAGLDEAWCQTFITDDVTLAEKFATDSRVAFLSFIGSAKVGWYLRSKLAPGARCALEHGGAAPVIIDRSAKLDALIEPVVKGGYYHSGQVCVSVQRIYVHESLQSEFVERLHARVAKLRVGDALGRDTELGPLILPRETERVTTWIDEAVAGGATLLGGGRVSATTLKPAVLVNPARDAKVSTLEVFGPVTCVYGYREVDEAIASANALPWSFQASVFSGDVDAALYVAKRIDGAAVMVNDHTAFRTDWMPFAGHRQSGYGVGGIPFTMRDMSHEKMVVLKSPSL